MRRGVAGHGRPSLVIHSLILQMTTSTTHHRHQPGNGGSMIRAPRAVGILATAIIVVAGTNLMAALQPASSPTSRVPGGSAGDPTTIQAPAGVAGSAASLSIEQLDRSIAAWSVNLAAEPQDFLSATNLGMLYHARGQLTGDLTDHERALAAAATALAVAPTYAPSRALDAAIRYTLHDFEGAHAAADSLYRDDPTQLGALATRADAALELGRIDESRRDLDVLATAAGGAAVDIRLARLAYLSGDADEAVRLARAARDNADESGAIDLGFYEFAMGEYGRLAGDSATARTGFEAALVIRPTDQGALLGLGRIEAFDGDLPAAIIHLENAVAVAPQPETLALLGDVRTASGDVAGAQESFETVRFIAQLGSIQEAVYDRQLLRFDLDHGGATTATLDAVRASVAARPDAAGHDLLAWALYRLGRFDEAAAEIMAARAIGADDARLRFHDGAIALASGDGARGVALIRRALAAGPALDPMERREAERLIAR
jgi:tetratricopeptide (TPR) repeat protein